MADNGYSVITEIVVAALLSLGAIWACNVLFGAGIPITPKTWFCAFILYTCVKE